MQKTILTVEDDDDLRNLIKEVLATNNFNVVEAADGAQALEAVEKYLPDLVLLDFGLPKVPGETVCVKIKTDHPDIIIIALTEKTSSSDVVHGLQIGADDYISKPFVLDELIARINTKFKTAPQAQIEPKEKVTPKTEKIILRESIALIIFRIIFTEVIFVFSLVTLSILFYYLNSHANISYLSGLFIIVLAGGLLLNVGIVISTILKWNTEYNEVSEDGIIKHSGFLNRKDQKFACNFVEGAKLEQSFLGLLLNYGTIELYDPALKEQVYLLNIPDPKKYIKTVQNTVSKEKDKPMPFVSRENSQ